MTSGSAADHSRRPEPHTPSESAALVISRALAADTPRRLPARGPVLLALAALLVAAGASGYLIGRSGSESDGRRTIESGAIRLPLPAGWRRSEPSRGVETLASDAVVARPRGGGARLVAAELPRGGLGLLPRAAAKSLTDVSGGERMRLGRVDAARYRAVEAARPRRRVALYATPTSGGVALAACVAPPSAMSRFIRRCERVVATIAISDGKASRLAAGGEVGYLNRTLARLDARREAVSRRLREARSPRLAARLVRELARSHAAAARALGNLPAASEAHRAGTGARRALRGVEAAYRGLAKVLGRAGRRPGAALRTVRRRDAALRRAVARL